MNTEFGHFRVGEVKKSFDFKTFFFAFSYNHFFSIQRAYGTLKQNLVIFKYTQVINFGESGLVGSGITIRIGRFLFKPH